jgi:hypothetical protein
MGKDFKLVNNGLYINPVTNDFELVESDSQHVENIIIAEPGWYKEFPSIGVGLQKYNRTSGKQQELDRAIAVNLQMDGKGNLKIRSILMPDGTYQFEIYAAPKNI